MSQQFLKRAIKKHFEAQGFKVNMQRIRLGNTEIDGEALGSDGARIAIEIKTAHDDLARGLGQLAESMAFGYNKAVLATTIRRAKKIDLTTFHYFGWTLMGVDSKGKIHKVNQRARESK